MTETERDDLRRLAMAAMASVAEHVRPAVEDAYATGMLDAPLLGLPAPRR